MNYRDTYCARAHVSGRVQGVFFRAFTARKAQSLKVRGYAINLPDGRVEVLASGTESDVRLLLDWLEDGSPMSEVRDVAWQKIDEPADLRNGFDTG